MSASQSGENPEGTSPSNDAAAPLANGEAGAKAESTSESGAQETFQSMRSAEKPAGIESMPMSFGRLAHQTPKRHLSETSEKVVYFLTLIAGSAFILIGKVSGWLAPVPAAVAAVVLIVVYFVFAYLAVRENKARSDRMGDNCYYLGFVYTLASLIATLIQIDQGADIQRLLGNFGVALVSTAAGIVARLVLIQFRSETDDVDQQARLAIAEAAEQMKSDLLGAAGVFQTLLVGSQEALRTSINQSVDLVAESARATQQLRELQMSPDVMNNALRVTVEQLQSAAASLAGAGKEIQAQAGAVLATAGAVERSESGLKRVDDVLGDLANTLSRQREATLGIIQALEAQQAFVGTHRAAMEADAERARVAAQKVYSALGELAETLVRRVS